MKLHRGSTALFVLALLCTFVASACQHSEISPTGNQPETSRLDDQDKQRIFSSFLTVHDVPEGWFLYYSGTEVVEGNTVHQQEFVSGEVIDQPYLDYIFVSQEIILYANKAQARKGYQKWLQPRLELEKQVPTEINFHSRADESRVGCSYGITDTQPENVCTAIARYDRLVSLLVAKVWDEDDEEQWFTWTDFERVLEAMDQRALEAAGR